MKWFPIPLVDQQQYYPVFERRSQYYSNTQHSTFDRCYQEALERQPGDHMINPRVHHSVADKLIAELKRAVTKMYSSQPDKSEW